LAQSHTSGRTTSKGQASGYTEKLLEVAERHNRIAQRARAKVTADDLPY